MRRFNSAACLLALAIGVGGILPAGVLQTPLGSRGWQTRLEGDRTCVVERNGSERSCLPEGVPATTDLAETASGWIAATYARGSTGHDLLLLRNRGQGPEALPSPPDRRASRGRPRIVTDGLRLVGLVWLEGDRQSELQVLSAEWLGTDWGPTTVVSRGGDGSQVAPHVTVLSDGSWLLVWTGFDGQDDETMWSLFDGHRWSAPQRLHEDNEVPDTTPSVLATRRGAIAAWNWFDGRDYRLRRAFFDGSHWRLDEALPGRGAGEPLLLERDGVSLLSFSTVVPREWVGIELDAAGRIRNRTSIRRDGYKAPVVDYSGGALRLTFQPDGSSPEDSGESDR